MKYIDAVLADLEQRFEGFNDSTRHFGLFYQLVAHLDSPTLDDSIEALGRLYSIDIEQLRVEILSLNDLLKSDSSRNLSNFDDLSYYILNHLSSDDFPMIQYFISIILVLPFCKADCERSFSAMNLIKSDLRNILKEILNELMLIYTRDTNQDIDMKKLTKTVVRTVWKYRKTEEFSDRYMEQLI